MKIKKMVIEHFKGVKFLEVNFGEKVTEIIGTNETGKSTLIDAYLWGHDGKDSRVKSNSDIRNVREPELDPRVTIDYGEIRFRRTFRQLRNGNNTTVYEVDRGAGFDPVNMKDTTLKGEYLKGYDTYIEEIFPHFRICADIFFFCSGMPKNGTPQIEEARKFVLDRGGNPSKDEIYHRIEDQTAIPILEKIFEIYGANEGLRVIKNRQKEIEKEITKLKGAVEARDQDIATSTPETPKEDLEKSREKTEKKILDLEERLKEISASADLYEAVQKAKDARRRAENLINEENAKNLGNWTSEAEALNTAFQAACREEDRKHFELMREYENKKIDLEYTLKRREKIITLEESKEKYIKLIELEKEKIFEYPEYQGLVFFEKEPEKNDVPVDIFKLHCQTCTYRLGAIGDIEERKAKHYENEERKIKVHNEQKELAKEFFDKARVDAISEYNAKIAEIEKEIAEINKIDFAEIEKELSELMKPAKQEIMMMKGKPKPEKIKFNSEPYDRAILEAETRLNNAKEELEERQKPVKEEIETEKMLLKQILEHLAMYEGAEKIKKLRDGDFRSHKEKTKELEDLKIKENALKEYNKALAGIVREKTKVLFGAEIELFRQQINGELKDDFDVLCETNEGLVPFSIANTATRIKTGLKVTAKLQKMLNSFPVIAVDNTESVAEFKELDFNQIVFLKMNRKVKTIKTRNFESITEYEARKEETI